MEAHAACPGLPERPRPVLPQPRDFLPGLAAVARLEQSRVLDAGIDLVRRGQRRLEVPDALELPRMRRAVVPLVGARHAIILELVADRVPGLPPVIGALDHLTEPTRRLRRVDAV